MKFNSFKFFSFNISNSKFKALICSSIFQNNLKLITGFRHISTKRYNLVNSNLTSSVKRTTIIKKIRKYFCTKKRRIVNYKILFLEREQLSANCVCINCEWNKYLRLTFFKRNKIKNTLLHESISQTKKEEFIGNKNFMKKIAVHRN